MSKTWKELESSRNRRLWITDVILPTTGLIFSALVIAQTSGYDVIGKAKAVGEKIKAKCRREP